MKHLQRVTAFILAAALIVQGVPGSLTARAEESAGSAGENTVSEVPQSDMRFVQTGFDNDEGILTMSLQVKLDTDAGVPQTVSEGMFTFQTDANKVVPVTRPSENSQTGKTEERKSFFMSNGSTAVAASKESQYMKDYLASGKAELVSENSFALTMSNDSFIPKYTGFMVSSAGAVDENTGLLDCYFQFMYASSQFPGWKLNTDTDDYEPIWKWNDSENRFESDWKWDAVKGEYVASAEKNIDPDSDPNIAVDGENLYVNVMEFDFQCYSGYENNKPKPATSVECLFSGSIKIPQSETEVDAILARFAYKDKYSSDTISMAMGGAGYISKQWDKNNYEAKDDGDAYYYYTEPKLSLWRKNGSSRSDWAKGTAKLITDEAAPGLWYPHMNDDYIVTGISASFANSVSSLEEPISDADFRVPQDSKGKETETGTFPRYEIPKATEDQDDIPVAYQMDKRSALKYILGTEVTDNSVATPEDENFDEFLSALTWEFVLSDGTRLNSIESLSENGRTVSVALDKKDGAEVTVEVPTEDGEKYLAKYATVSDKTAEGESGKWDGTKLWEVYRKGEDGQYEFFMRTPVGVTLDFKDDTEIYWYSVKDSEYKQSAGVAPQLHVTSYAADSANYIWSVTGTGTTAGELTFRPVYKSGGVEWTLKSPLTVRLYKSASIPTTSDIQTDKNIAKVADATGNEVDGFWVGKAAANGTLSVDGGVVKSDSNETATDEINDAVSKGITIQSVVYDQYGNALDDKPKEIKLVLATDKGETNYVSPFEVVSAEDGPADSYTIKYKSGKGVNDVKPGVYLLVAIFEKSKNSQVETEKLLYVKKSDNRLTYINTFLSDANHDETKSYVTVETGENGKQIEGRIVEVKYNVPERTDKVTKTLSSTIWVSELANQWRDVNESLGDDSLLQNYDIVEGLRTRDGDTTISISKAKQKMSFDIDISYDGSDEGEEAPRGLGLDKLATDGTFTYSSDVLNDSKFTCRITASYGGETVFVEYRFTFVRDLVNLRLAGMTVLTPTDRDLDYIRVPLPSETKDPVQITFIAKDQYNSDLSWDYVLEAYKPGGSMNNSGIDKWPDYPEYGIYLYQDPKAEETAVLPQGITLDHDNSTIIVDSTAKTSSFQIYAKLGSTESLPVTVRIVRDNSKPNVVKDITYSASGESGQVTELKSPGKNSLSENVYTASTAVYDQYQEVLTPVKSLTSNNDGTYKPTWTMTVSPAEAKNYLVLDSSTGELTVKRCAPDCTVTVKMKAETPYGDKSKTVTLKVSRDKAVPETLTVVDSEVVYPTADEVLADVTKSTIALTAKGVTQYGDNQLFKQGGESGVTWTLQSAEFYGPNGVTQTVTGDDIVNASGSWIAENSVVLSSGGVLQFRSIISKEKMPLSITVVAKYGSTESTAKKITIKWDQTDKIQELVIPNEYKYKDGIQMPVVGDVTHVALKVNVRNQYGLIVDTPVTWSVAKNVKGMKLVTNADGSSEVQVDSTVEPNSTLQLTAKCQGLTVELPITVIQGQELEVTDIEITGVKDSSGKALSTKTDASGAKEVTVKLPAKTGDGYNSYKFSCNVLSQFGRPMSGDVDWSIESETGGITATADSSTDTTNTIKVSFTETARDTLKNGGTVSFTVVATSEGKPVGGTKNTCVVKLELAESEAAYAVPEVTDYGENPNVVGSVTKPSVPEWGKDATKVTLAAKVYDQYGMVMTGTDATIKLVTTDSSVKLAENILSITSEFTGDLITLQAYPKGQTTKVTDESKLVIEVYANPAYPYGLKIGDYTVTDTDISYDYDIPRWNSIATANIKGEDTVEQHQLSAVIVNQRGGEITGLSATMYPIWEFVGEHAGVEFDNAEADGSAKGGQVTLNVSNQAAQAIADGKSSCTVTLKLTTNGKSGGNFEKTVKVNLSRGERVASYMYIDGSDESGTDNDGLSRPYYDKKSVVYQFSPVVYDQYGQPMNVQVNMDLDLNTLENLSGIEVEKVFNNGESEEKGDEPIAYKIYWVEYISDSTARAEQINKVLIAEFDRSTGKLTVYTACSSECLAQLKIKAEYGSLPPKSLTVVNNQETSYPYSIALDRSHGDFMMGGGQELINDYITPVVSDQYGKNYPLNKLTQVTWGLYLSEKDKDGKLQAYKEYDEDGYEVAADDYLLKKTDSTTAKGTTLTVNPEQFKSGTSAILQCIAAYMSGGQVKTVTKEIQIRIYQPSYGGGITVTFEPGEHGKLVGAASVGVSAGGCPQTPGVKTETGYGFIGWTADGKEVVDASQVEVYNDVTYTAVYKDITGTKFLAGYTDGTVRPTKNVTRGEFIAMLVQAEGGYDSEKNYGGSYKDVAKNKWYANYIAYARLKGLTNGYPDGTFRPEKSITRAEAAVLLANAAGVSEGGTGTFSDVKEGVWYAASVEALYKAGIVSGLPDGTFRPNKYVTRAEAVTMIIMMTENALDKLQRANIQEYAYCPFSDIKKGYWAYAYILRAAGIA